MTRRIVELAGPAGAGKTTLARALLSDDGRTQLGVEAGRIGSMVGALSLGPVLAGARLSTGGRGWTEGELRNLVYLQAWRRELASRSSGTYLLDHGPVFRLAALAAWGPPMARTPAFRKWWTRTAQAWGRLLDGVVWLDAPDAVLVHRIDSRERTHRIQNAEAETASAFLARYRDAYDDVLDLLSRMDTPVLRIDTSTRTPESLAATVRSSLLQEVGGG